MTVVDPTERTFKIGRGDLLFPLEAILTDARGNPVDLSAASAVRFHMRAKRIDDGGTALIDQPASLLDAVNGRVRYDWQTGDTDDKGRYYAEFEVMFAAGPLTFPNTPSKIIVLIGEDVD